MEKVDILLESVKEFLIQIARFLPKLALGV
jgi:hypothetical protein